MSKVRLVHLIYGITLSLLLVASGICFMVACVDIYRSGSNPFTPESIGSHFKSICVPVYITIALVIGSIPLNIFLPLESVKKGTKISKKQTLLSLYSRFDYTKASEERLGKINKLRYTRLALYIVAVLLLLGGTIASLVYALNIENFKAFADDNSSLINSSIIEGSLVVLRYMIIPLIYCIALVFVDSSIASRELLVVKATIKEDKAMLPKDAPSNETIIDKIQGFFTRHKKTILLVLRIALGILALVLIITGIVNGGMYTVLQKANKLCQECIGLG